MSSSITLYVRLLHCAYFLYYIDILYAILYLYFIYDMVESVSVCHQLSTINGLPKEVWLMMILDSAFSMHRSLNHFGKGLFNHRDYLLFCIIVTP